VYIYIFIYVYRYIYIYKYININIYIYALFQEVAGCLCDCLAFQPEVSHAGGFTGGHRQGGGLTCVCAVHREPRSCEGEAVLMMGEDRKREIGRFREGASRYEGKTRSGHTHTEEDADVWRKCDESSVTFPAPADSAHTPVFGREESLRFGFDFSP